jgi:antitoxin component YwqK of YwqJK toxin-antitoxin module
MYFPLYNLGIEYSDDDDTPIFIFTDDTNHKIIRYWSIQCGGHQASILVCKNNQLHGTQYQWWSIQEGGHLFSVTNYKNNQLHGIQWGWYSIQYGGHQRSIENYKNGKLFGTRQYWELDGSYHTEQY